MKNREKIYFFITLVLMFVGTILQAILLNFCYEADKRLYITGTLPVVYYVLSFVTTVFALSGLIVLKKKDGKTERLPEKNGAVLFFGVLAGLFFAAVFALSTLEGVVTMGTKLADQIVQIGAFACSLLCGIYFIYVSLVRRPNGNAAGLLGITAMAWCVFYAVSVYFDMTYALNSPVRIFSMLTTLSLLLYLSAEIRYFLLEAHRNQYLTYSFLLLYYGFSYGVPMTVHDFVSGDLGVHTVCTIAQVCAALYAFGRLISIYIGKEEEEMEYTFSYYERLADVDWDNVPKAMVDKYGWGYDYRPLCYARGVYAGDTGLVIKMTAFEKEPRATKTEYMDAVCNDSCMEFFFSADKVSYANFEFNALGTQHTSAGAPGARGSIDQFTEIPYDKAEIFPDRWELTLILSHQNVRDITGKELQSGARFYGNFYKCGDECEQKHYGMWSEVKTEKPSFHQPEYFGTLLIG